MTNDRSIDVAIPDVGRDDRKAFHHSQVGAWRGHTRRAATGAEARADVSVAGGRGGLVRVCVRGRGGRGNCVPTVHGARVQPRGVGQRSGEPQSPDREESAIPDRSAHAFII